MSFLNKVNKSLSKATKMSSNLAAQTKLKYEINEKQTAINKQYKQLGIMYYHDNKDGIEETCQLIDQLNADIEDKKTKIETLEPSKTVCTSCKAILDDGLKFCKLCGGSSEIVKSKELKATT